MKLEIWAQPMGSGIRLGTYLPEHQPDNCQWWEMAPGRDDCTALVAELLLLSLLNRTAASVKDLVPDLGPSCEIRAENYLQSLGLNSIGTQRRYLATGLNMLKLLATIKKNDSAGLQRVLAEVDMQESELLDFIVETLLFELPDLSASDLLYPAINCSCGFAP